MTAHAMAPPRRISIEAGIAAGKTTLLRSLAQEGWEVHLEPVEQWEELLNLFYGDRQRWAFALDTKVLLSYARCPPPCPGGAPVLFERSPYSSRHVFAQMNFNDAALSPKEWALYKALHDRVAWEPDIMIYIRTTPQVCMNRLLQRARPSEGNVQLDYLSKLHWQHTNMLKYYSGTIYVVDGTRPADVVLQRVKDILRAYCAHAPLAAGPAGSGVADVPPPARAA